LRGGAADAAIQGFGFSLFRFA